MKKNVLAILLRTASTKDLNELLSLKKDLEALEKKQKELERQFSAVSREISSIQTSFGGPSQGKTRVRTKKPTRRKRGRPATKARKAVNRRGRVRQPPLSSLIAEILRGKRRSLKVNEITEALLKEKKYKTRAKDFKSSVRILLYKNEKGLFKRVGPGRFALASGKKK